MSKQRRVVAALALVTLVVSLAACGATVPKTAPKPAPVALPQPLPHTIPQVPVNYTQPHHSRPNILVIESDDMRVDELRWMPNVEKYLQDKGIYFKNSFAPYPLCCPSRASFLTGKYAHNHHVLSTAAPFAFESFNDKTTIATVLHKGGYRTALVGKYLNGYGQMHRYHSTKHSLHYIPPGWSDWYAGSDHIWHSGDAHQGGTYNYFDLAQNINGKIVGWPGRYSTDVLAHQTRKLITTYGKKKQPWFIWFTPIAPHFGKPMEPDDPPTMLRSDGHTEVWKTPARPDWVKGIFDKEITHGLGTPVHGSAEADMSDKPRYLRSLPNLTAQEKLAERNLTRQRAEALYVLDQQVGKTLNQLRRTGQYNNTIIVFTSDNGYYLGEHRKRQGKITLHEPSLRVPLMIDGPGIPHGVRYDPITTVDLAPTIAAYAGLKRMPGADGINMVPDIRHGDRGWDRAVVTEGMMSEYSAKVRTGGFNSDLNTRGLRLGRWKITVYSSGEIELYDLKTDPLELHSLQNNPKYDKIKRRMLRLWHEYKDCKMVACAKPIPKAFRLSVAQEKALTNNEAAKVERYYSDPGAVDF